jgi:GNAT superfamily N-acetyltransferase
MQKFNPLNVFDKEYELSPGKYVVKAVFTNEKNEEVGMATFIYTDLNHKVKQDLPTTAGWIETIKVFEPYRNLGYGRSIISYIYDYLKSKGCTEIHLQSASELEEDEEKLAKWYEKLGFIKRPPFEYNLMFMKI